MAEPILRTKTIRRLLAKRMILATLFVASMASFTSSLIAWKQIRSSQNHSWDLKLESAKKLVSEQLESGDFVALEVTANALATHPQVVRLNISATFGSIIHIKKHAETPEQQSLQKPLLDEKGSLIGELEVQLKAFKPTLKHSAMLLGLTLSIVVLCFSLSLWVYRMLDRMLITPVTRLHAHIGQQASHRWERLKLNAPKEITELYESLDTMADQLIYNANTDLLTGLPNRRHFMQLLKEACLNSEASNDTLWIWFVDLDHFKRINDQLGHRVGDQVVEEIGLRLSRHDHPTLQFARVGGDEFVGFFVTPDEDQSNGITQWLMSDVCRPIKAEDHTINISFSIGIACSRAKSIPANLLLHRADLALYSAKNNGRGGISYYDDSMEKTLRAATEITRSLNIWKENATAQSYFVAQAIRFNDTLDLWGAEILCRLPITLNQAEEMANPQTVLSVAKELQLIEFITEQAILAGIQWLNINAKKKGELKVNINLNRHQLVHPRLNQQIDRLLMANNIAPQQLVFEITEDFYLEDPETRDALSGLNDRGCLVALDDFGTGYSSLACIHSLPIDIVKFDKSLLKLAQKTPKVAAFFEDLTDLTEGQGKIIIAEGIETIQDLARVRKSGCHLGQGYFFGRPGQEVTSINTLNRVKSKATIASQQNSMNSETHVPS